MGRAGARTTPKFRQWQRATLPSSRSISGSEVLKDQHDILGDAPGQHAVVMDPASPGVLHNMGNVTAVADRDAGYTSFTSNFTPARATASASICGRSTSYRSDADTLSPTSPPLTISVHLHPRCELDSRLRAHVVDNFLRSRRIGWWWLHLVDIRFVDLHRTLSTGESWLSTLPAR